MTDENMLSQLSQKISEIDGNLSRFSAGGTPLNERMTESVVINPLLSALGYEVWEIFQQETNPAVGNIPDYTLLPHTPRTWFLEVKRFGLSLTDKEASQAVTYASNHGKRWAVLTNGRAWWIYHAHLPVPLQEKCILKIDDIFDGPPAARHLSLLSRAAMQADELTQFWTQTQTISVIRAELQNPNSPARQALLQAVSDALHQPVSDDVLAVALADLLSLPNRIDPVIVVPPVTVSPDPVIIQPDNGLTLAYLPDHWGEVTGTKPASIHFPDGRHTPVSAWNRILYTVVQNYAPTKLPPLPFKPSSGFKSLLSETKTHPNGKPMQWAAEIKTGGESVFLEQGFTVYDSVKYAAKFLDAIGISPESVTVELK